MGKAACRKCDKCGRYSDITVDICECGAKLTELAQTVVDAGRLGDKKGSINESCSYYVQICVSCHEKLYSASKRNPFITCYKCKTTMLAEPVEVDDEQAIKQKEQELLDAEMPKPAPAPKPAPKPAPAPNPAPSYGAGYRAAKPAPAPKPASSPKGGSSRPKHRATNSLALFTENGLAPIAVLSPEQAISPVMMGRDSLLSDYLHNDKRVGRNHCSLMCNNSKWFLTDNDSNNGTFVNNKYIKRNGVTVLKTGDLIKFGHDPDSFVARVEIDE